MTEAEPTGEQILAVPMGQNDADATTVRGYLVELLSLVWRDEEAFNGKRPFGNSGWQVEVHRALFDAGLLDGSYDEEYDELSR